MFKIIYYSSHEKKGDMGCIKKKKKKSNGEDKRHRSA